MDSRSSQEPNTPLFDAPSISALSLPYRPSSSVHGLPDSKRPALSLPHRPSSPVHGLPDSKSQSIPRRLFLPWPLFHLVLRVETRDGRTQGLSEPPKNTFDIPMPMLLHARFEEIDMSIFRSHHLSFESFQKMLSEAYPPIALDLNNDELGWVYQSQFPDRTPQYFPIVNESTFQNAIGVMRNQTSMQNPAALLNVHLFSPRHKEGIFRRSRRARQTPDPVNLEHTKSSPDSANAATTDATNTTTTTNAINAATATTTTDGTNVANAVTDTWGTEVAMTGEWDADMPVFGQAGNITEETL